MAGIRVRRLEVGSLKKKKNYFWSSLVVQGLRFCVLIVAAWVTAVLWVQSLAWELPHAVGMVKKI